MRIGSSNDSAAVKEQYKTSKGLNTRISLHEKYSTNKQGYGNWLVSNYDIFAGMKVLELGCGTGSLWMGRDDILDEFGSLVLTDLSEGMIKTARENIGNRDNIAYRVADIQELGENNFIEELAEWFKLSGESFKPNHNFTMQNGGEKLKTAFAEAEARIYKDSLHITDIDDLVDYLTSMTSLKVLSEFPVEKLKAIITEHAVNGVVDLPKEYGMFIARGYAKG